MTFFYNLNKKLDEIRATPELKHSQLNERDMSRAAKGYEKYGKEGMEALAKAGRDGKSLDPVRKKYDKYDESVDEGLGDMAKKVGGMAKKVGGAVLNKLGHGSDEDMIRDLQKKAGVPQTGKKPMATPKESVEPDVYFGDDAYIDIIQDMVDNNRRNMSPSRKPRVLAAAKRIVNSEGGQFDPQKFEDAYERVMNFSRDMHEGVAEDGVDKAAFAKLAPPKDKITFADKIAGAKKEVDEMLGDVAAEAMKAALTPKQKKLDRNQNGSLDANDFAMLRKGSKGKQETDEGWDDMMKDVERRRGQTKKGEITHGAKHDIEDTGTGRRVTRRTDPNTGYSVGADADDKPADGEKRGRGRPKKADKAPERVTAKATKHKGGRKTNEGEGEGSDLVKLAKVIQSCTTREQLETARKMAQNFLRKHSSGNDGIAFAGIGKDMRRRDDVVSDIERKNAELKGGRELDEKAVSKKQQKFMGMVHATQKGEKAPSKEVAKVAKTMKKGDAEDFASTKHKGLPEKKKPEGKSDAPKKKKEKTEEAGGVGTPTASSGFGFGKGIYDSMNFELEQMISEGMNINMSMNTDANGGPSKSLTVTATDDDALKLSALLKNAGLGNSSEEGYGGTGYQSACGCGTPDCSCGDEEVDEAYGDNAVTQNSPNWPTNQETAQDNLEYSGGLNKPKSTGQTTVPVIASQEERQESYAEAEEDAIKRMMEMAGIKEGKKPDFLDVDKDGDKAEPFKKAVDDKKEKKVDEGILAATANLWKEYKGNHGV